MTADEARAFSETHADLMARLADEMHNKFVLPLFDMSMIKCMGATPMQEERAIDQFDSLTTMGAKLDLISGNYIDP